MYHYRIIHRDDASSAQACEYVRSVANCWSARKLSVAEHERALAQWIACNKPAFPCVIVDSSGCVLARDERTFC